MRRPRVILAIVAGVVVIAATAVYVALRERPTVYLTDGATIRVPVDSVEPRDVLWTPAEAWSDLVNSIDEEYEPRWSPDGRTVIFVRGRVDGRADLWSMSRTATGWTEPAPIEAINTDANELGPELSTNGRFLYFASDREDGTGGFDLWLSEFVAGAFQTPVNLGPRINGPYDDYGPALTPDGRTLYFVSNRVGPPVLVEDDTPRTWTSTLRAREGAGSHDIYVVAIEDTESTPTLVAALDAEGNNGAPDVTAGGDFIYFASDRRGGFGGFDLYRARLRAGDVETPVNLGAPINTAANELDPALSWAGFRIHFSSDRPRGDEVGRADYDLYRSVSREVAVDRGSARALIDARALLLIAWWLLLILLALLLLWALWRMIHSTRLQAVSLIARCLLASLIIHVLLMLLFTVWHVGSMLSDQLRPGRATQITTAAPTDASGLAEQVRGGLSAVQVASDTFAALPASNLTTIAMPEPASALETPSTDPADTTAITAITDAPLRAAAAPAETMPTPTGDVTRATEAALPAPPTPTPERTAERATSVPTPAPTSTASAAEVAAPVAPPSVRGAPAPDASLAATPGAAPDVPVSDTSPAAPAPTWQAAVRASDARTPNAPSDEALRANATEVDGTPRAPTVASGAATEQAPSAPTRAPGAPAAPAASIPDTALADAPVEPAPAVASVSSPPATDAPAMQTHEKVDLPAPAVADARPRATEATQTLEIADADSAPAGETRASAPAPDATRTAPAPEPARVDTAAVARPDIGTPAPLDDTGPRALAQVAITAAPPAEPAAMPAPADTDSRSATYPGEVSATVALAPDASAAPLADDAPRTSEPRDKATAPAVAAAPLSARALTAPMPGPTPALPIDDAPEADLAVAAATVDANRLPRPQEQAAASAANEATLAGGLEGNALGDGPAAVRADGPPNDTPRLPAPDAVRAPDRVPALAAGPLTTPPLGPSPTPDDRDDDEALPAAQPTNASVALALPTPNESGDVTAARERASEPEERVRLGTDVRSDPAAELDDVVARDVAPAPDEVLPAARVANVETWSAPLPSDATDASSPAAPTTSTLAATRTPAAMNDALPRPDDVAPMTNETNTAAAAPAPSPAPPVPAARIAAEAPSFSGAPTNTEPPALEIEIAPTAPGLRAALPTPSTTAATPAAPPVARTDALAPPRRLALDIPDELAAPGTPAPPARVAPDDPRTVTPLADRAALEPASAPDAPPLPRHTALPVTPSAAQSLATVDLPAPADAPPLDSPDVLPTAVPRTLANVTLPRPDETSIPTNPYKHREPERREVLVQKMGGTRETEAAVASALAWLARAQSADGRWDGESHGARAPVDIALTGLSLLSFLAADHTHVAPGQYQDTTARAIEWLLLAQNERGSLLGHESMYSHAIATIALAEAYGMTGDGRLENPVRAAATFIMDSRHSRTGGWRYAPGQFGDTSVLGWQIMALTSVRRAGIEVPDEAFETGRRWLQRVEAGSGRYRYQPGEEPSPAMSAESMFVKQLLGDGSDAQGMDDTAAYLLENLPRWDDGSTYYWYYATLALFQQQGPAWQRWNARIRDTLVAAQVNRGDMAGSWEPNDRWARTGGRVYQTAICTLTLEVYYRYLPSFVRELE